MEVLYWIGGFIGGIIVISLVVRAITRMINNGKCRKGWEPFAQAHGLSLDRGGVWKGPSMRGRWKDHEVEVSLERITIPYEGGTERTVFRAFLPSPIQSGLAIGHRSTKRFLSKRLKDGRFVKTGNPAYDGYLKVRTNDPNRVKVLFQKEGGGEFFSHFVAGRSLAMATSKGVEFAYDQMELGEKRLEVGLDTVTDAVVKYQTLLD